MTQTKLEIIGPYTPEHEGPFCTRDGKLVDLKIRDGRGDYPLSGYMGESKQLVSWASTGLYIKGDHCGWIYDLMNAREVPVAREFWVNRYAGGGMIVYLSKEEAEKYNHVDCEIIHVREVLPGEGE